MAKKSRSTGKTGPSKSQAIRDHMKTNPKDAPIAVAAALKKKGVKVTPAYVSMIKSTDKKRSSAKVRGPGRPAGRSKSNGASGLSMDSLLRAKKMADQMGGVAQAKAALDALSKLVD